MDNIVKNITPLFNRILVKRYERKIKSGIVIPEQAKEGSLRERQGEIVAIGPGVNKDISPEDIELKPGDKIIWGSYASAKLPRTESGYVIMNDDDVLAVIKDYLED